MERFIKKFGFLLIPVVLLNIQNRNIENTQSKTGTNNPRESDSVVVLTEMKISFNELMKSVKWRRNPFIPMYHLHEKKEENLTDRKFLLRPVLRNTFWQDGARIAHINEQKFQKGEFFWDMKILYIGETIVVLEKDGLPCLLLAIEKENW